MLAHGNSLTPLGIGVLELGVQRASSECDPATGALLNMMHAEQLPWSHHPPGSDARARAAIIFQRLSDDLTTFQSDSSVRGLRATRKIHLLLSWKASMDAWQSRRATKRSATLAVPPNIKAIDAA